MDDAARGAGVGEALNRAASTRPTAGAPVRSTSRPARRGRPPTASTNGWASSPGTRTSTAGPATTRTPEGRPASGPGTSGRGRRRRPPRRLDGIARAAASRSQPAPRRMTTTGSVGGAGPRRPGGPASPGPSGPAPARPWTSGPSKAASAMTARRRTVALSLVAARMAPRPAGVADRTECGDRGLPHEGVLVAGGQVGQSGRRPREPPPPLARRRRRPPPRPPRGRRRRATRAAAPRAAWPPARRRDAEPSGCRQ